MPKKKKKAGRPKKVSKAKGKRGGLSPNQYLTDEQLKNLISRAKLEADKGKSTGYTRAIVTEAIIRVLALSGVRASELCSLNIGDTPVTHKKEQLHIRSGKGNIERTIDIPPSLVKYISRFIKLHRKKAKPNEPLFINERGRRLSYRGLYSRIKTLGRKCGLTLSPHKLRHTFGTRLYNIEKDLFYVSDQLGHSGVDVTRVYSKTNNRSRRKQIEAIDLPE